MVDQKISRLLLITIFLALWSITIPKRLNIGMFRASENCINLIKEFESLRLEAYPDFGGVWTIGWGTTKGVRPGMKITKEEADVLFLRDLKMFENSVNNLVEVEINQHQFDALVSFVYNVGTSKFASSTLLKLLNQGRFDEVPDQFRRWVHDWDAKKGKMVKLRGLIRRRESEVELFMTPVSEKISEEIEEKPQETKKEKKSWFRRLREFLGL